MSNPEQYVPTSDDLPGKQTKDTKRAKNRALVCSISGEYESSTKYADDARRWRESYQARLWREHYGQQLPSDIEIEYLNLADAKGVRAELPGGEQMLDTGDVIHLQRGSDYGPSDAAISAMLACADAKKWSTLSFHGSRFFRERSALAALTHKPPFEVNWKASGITDEVRARIEAKARAMRGEIVDGNDVPTIASAPSVPSVAPVKPKGQSDEFDDFADELRQPYRESNKQMRERLEKQDKERKAAELASIEAEKRDQAIDDVMSEGLNQIPGHEERQARARRSRMR
ncbi:MAG: LPD7 domain-containing protein [Sedimenticola sp.]